MTESQTDSRFDKPVGPIGPQGERGPQGDREDLRLTSAELRAVLKILGEAVHVKKKFCKK